MNLSIPVVVLQRSPSKKGRLLILRLCTYWPNTSDFSSAHFLGQVCLPVVLPTHLARLLSFPVAPQWGWIGAASCVLPILTWAVSYGSWSPSHSAEVLHLHSHSSAYVHFMFLIIQYRVFQRSEILHFFCFAIFIFTDASYHNLSLFNIY